MKILILFIFLSLSMTGMADDLAVSLENDSSQTTVRVTPIEAPPEDLCSEIQESNIETNTSSQWWKVTLFGLGLAPVEFFISTALHEGSHALAIEAVGGKVTDFQPYPHQHEGMPFRFGDVHWEGNVSQSEQALTTVAPMLLDTAVIGTYGGLVLGNALPQNRFAKMGMFVFAAGHWVDLANHIIARNELTDTRKIERYFQTEHGLTQAQSRLAVRGSQALVLAAGGYFLYRGLKDIFKPNKILDSSQLVKGSKRKEKKSKNFFEQHDIYVAPVVGSDMNGFMIGGRF
jgi:hypothetical protein